MSKQVPFKAICTTNGITLDTVDGGTECVSIVNFAVESMGNFVNHVVDSDVSVGGARKQPQNDVYLNKQG